jgi:large subunit ribosomal protein L23
LKDPRRIIRHPLVTEKSSDLKEASWYVFAVDRSANKREISYAVEKIFKVKVDKVRTLTKAGKSVKRFGRKVGKSSSEKKAYVKLKEGTIELFEGV